LQARQLQQSEGAQAFYTSFAQKARQEGPPKLLPLPDTIQAVQKAFKNGQVTNFIQTTGPQNGMYLPNCSLPTALFILVHTCLSESSWAG
jgi:hypothetical protein